MAELVAVSLLRFHSRGAAPASLAAASPPMVDGLSLQPTRPTGAHAAPPAGSWPPLLLERHEAALSVLDREPYRLPVGPGEGVTASSPAVATPLAAQSVWMDSGLAATDTGHPCPPESRGGPFARATALGASLDRSKDPRIKLKRLPL